MGIFSDIKDSVEAAQAITADDTVLSPAPRLDSLVIDPASGEQRHRSDYAGTIWFGGRPQIVSTRGLPGATVEIDSVLGLPDSHKYAATAAESAQIQVSGALLSARATSAGGDAQIMGLEARLEADPADANGHRIELGVNAVALLPVGVSYRVTIICSPEAIAPSSP